MSSEPVSETARYIAERLPLRAVPGLPGMRLHLATPQSGLGGFLAERDGGTPYWAYAWPGGLALAQHLFAHPETVRDQSVLDFGAGSGLVAIAAMLCGARTALAVETDPLAAIAIALNAEANGIAVEIALGPRAPETVTADAVLAADTFYAENVAGAAMSFLVECARRGHAVLIGDIGRRYLPADRLKPLAQYAVPDIGDAAALYEGRVFTLSPDAI